MAKKAKKKAKAKKAKKAKKAVAAKKKKAQRSPPRRLRRSRPRSREEVRQEGRTEESGKKSAKKSRARRRPLRPAAPAPAPAPEPAPAPSWATPQPGSELELRRFGRRRQPLASPRKPAFLRRAAAETLRLFRLLRAGNSYGRSIRAAWRPLAAKLAVAAYPLRLQALRPVKIVVRMQHPPTRSRKKARNA